MHKILKRYLVTLHKKAVFKGFLPLQNKRFSGICTTVKAFFGTLFGYVEYCLFERVIFFGKNAKNRSKFFVIIVHSR